MIGESIGEYQIKAVIGEGGMATVYKAYQPSVDRFVAIKLLPRQHSEDSTFLKRFQHEARIVAQLEHPAILPIYAYGEHENRPYIVMRLVETGSLRKAMFYDTLTTEDILRITGQIADALDHAHAQGIVHRDIKPSNILLDKNGNAYLTDFGIAKIMGTTTQITTDGVVGTPSYMSPEQCQGKPASAASDIYGLGAIIYELLAGKPPYEADSPLAVMYMQVKEPVPSLTKQRPDLPAAMDRVIGHALAKRAETRFKSAKDMVTSVRRVLTAPRPDATSQKQAAAPGKGDRQQANRLWLLLPAALFIAAIVGIVSLFWGDIREQMSITSALTGAPPTETIFAITATPESAGGLLEPTNTPEGGVVQPTTTPTFEILATPTATVPTILITGVPGVGEGRLVFTEGSNERAEITILSIDGTARTPLTDNNVYDGEPDWSPDTRLIAFESSRTGDINLFVMNSDGTGIVQISDSPQPDRHPDWSPDGQVIIYESGVGNQVELFAVSPDGSSRFQLTENSDGDRAPQFSPDGTQVAFMTTQRGNGWEIAIMRYPEADVLAYFDCPDVDCRFPTWSPDGTSILFNTLNASNDVSGIWMLDVETGESSLLLGGGENGRPVWSGDGLLIFYNRSIEGTTDLFRYNLSTGIEQRLTVTPDDAYAPDWGN